MEPTTPWRAQADALVQAATLAPSSHNTQPWRFCVTPTAVALYADRTRALPSNDPADRELTISCGAALLNLRVAAARAGMGSRITLCPTAAEPDLLARLSVAEREPADPALAALADALPARHTHRAAMAERHVERPLIHRLAEAAAAEHVRLEPLLNDEQRAAAARLVVRGDRAQWSDPLWRRELAAWMRPRQAGDGLTVPRLAAPIIRLVIRRLDLGQRVAAENRRLVETAPLLALLSTGGDGVTDWLAAGQGLQRLLLTACRAGLKASYLNQPVQVPRLRTELRHLFGVGAPQLLLRLGYPSAGSGAKAAPRRGVAAVTAPDTAACRGAVA
ncbi:hypothetical protein [Thiohalocapsa sp. ML1]|uniref:Acg family FMN-binding oxidoreductase n=1 Tax=Thiohalocapsa sp. ML1 TaxID=1431688 RepID=UPI00073203CE|nr:hypothetical protein [Thiohalocapsa sp. ML1]